MATYIVYIIGPIFIIFCILIYVYLVRTKNKLLKRTSTEIREGNEPYILKCDIGDIELQYVEIKERNGPTIKKFFCDKVLFHLEPNSKETVTIDIQKEQKRVPDIIIGLNGASLIDGRIKSKNAANLPECRYFDRPQLTTYLNNYGIDLTKIDTEENNFVIEEVKISGEIYFYGRNIDKAFIASKVCKDKDVLAVNIIFNPWQYFAMLFGYIGICMIIIQLVVDYWKN